MEILKAAKRKERERRLEALADGLVPQRSAKFKPKKGKGSYRRKGKYPDER